MKKRILSVLLTVVMLIGIMPTAFAATPKVMLTVEASNTAPNVGDEVTFTLYIQTSAEGSVSGFELPIDVPAGLTYVPSSGQIDSSFKSATNAENFEWIEIGTKFFCSSSALEGLSGLNTRRAVGTFKCTVNNDASGTYNVGVSVFSLEDKDVETVSGADLQNEKASVTVTVPHTHVYDQETLNFLVSPATCTSPAVYHKSCACGAEGTETFTSGSALGHDYTQKFEDAAHLKTAASKCTEHNIYWYDCSRCDSNAKNDTGATDKYFTSATTGSHSFTEEIEDAAHYVAGTGTNCQSVKKYYYDCAYCNQIGTTTWDSTTYGEHNYAATWSSDADGHWHECSLCHDKKDNAAHTPGAAATETTPQKCTKCDYTITPALGHTHSMTPVAANPATCTADGNTAYYVCSGCSKWFEDATGSVEITDHSSVVIGHLGHDFAPATCTAPKTCKRDGCGATEGSALGHDYTKQVETEAYLKTAASKCTEYNVYWYACSRCDANAKDDAAATDKYYTSTTAGNHSFTEKIEDAAHYVAGTGTDCQSVKKYYYDCAYCDQIGTATWDSTTYGPHDYATTWSSDADKHWHECSCGDKSEEAAHTASDWITDTAATATTDGTKHKECNVCHRVLETGTIPATGGSSGGGGGGVSTYAITVNSAKNGDVTSSHKSAAKGTTITLTVEPDKGYTLETITATDASGNKLKLTEKDGKYTFTMPASKVTVKATFMEDNSMLNFFVDVPASAYYYDAVMWAAKNGITGGVDDTHFAPNATCTRAQAVTFLWRAAGSPAPKNSMMPFTDVPAGSYYETAVLWAVENGITKGTSETMFSPDATCTRAQIVTFLWRANGSPAVSGNSAFTDVASDAYYAAAVTWAEKNYVTGGIGGGLFGSNNNCTRAQIVTFIYRSVK